MKIQIQLLRAILIIALIAFLKFASAQPSIQWQHTIGGSGDDNGSIIKASNGRYYAFGATTSTDGDFTNNLGGYDAFLAECDAEGNILWQKTYGGSGDDIFQAIIESSSALVLAGYTISDDFDVAGNHGGYDGWVVKLNFDGDIISQHCYGGSGDDYLWTLGRGNGSSYLCAGWSNSNDGDVSGNHGGDDGWVLKLNHSFGIKWSKLIGGGKADDFASGVLQTDDGKIVAVGRTESSIGGKNHGSIDVFLVKMNQQGNVLYKKCYGGDDIETSDKALLTPDGDILFCGIAVSENGDVTDQHGLGDSWIGKVDPSDGHLIWAKCYGKPDSVEVCLAMLPVEGGGIIGLGAQSGEDLDFLYWDALAFKIDADGNELWSKTFGGNDADLFGGTNINAGYENEDGSVTVAGYTLSTDGDVTDQHGEGDVWLVKLAENGERISDAQSGSAFREFDGSVIDFRDFPNPFSTLTTIAFNLAESQNTALMIFDASGRLIRTLVNEQLSEGTHTLTWNARDENGNQVGDGIYFLRMQTENVVKTISLSVVR